MPRQKHRGPPGGPRDDRAAAGWQDHPTFTPPSESSQASEIYDGRVRLGVVACSGEHWRAWNALGYRLGTTFPSREAARQAVVQAAREGGSP